MKYSYDVLGKEALNALDHLQISPPLSSQLPRNQSRAKGESKPKRDSYALLKEHYSEGEKLGQLWDEINTVPEWVDWEQIARGQEVFYRYGGVAMTAVSLIPLFFIR